jgi:hypothetical protein
MTKFRPIWSNFNRRGLFCLKKSYSAVPPMRRAWAKHRPDSWPSSLAAGAASARRPPLSARSTSCARFWLRPRRRPAALEAEAGPEPGCPRDRASVSASASSRSTCLRFRVARFVTVQYTNRWDIFFFTYFIFNSGHVQTVIIYHQRYMKWFDDAINYVQKYNGSYF